MPVVKVFLLPAGLPQEEYINLYTAIRKAVAGVPELHLTLEEVSVIEVQDLCSDGLGSEIVVEIAGLFSNDERTAEVRNRLCEAVVMVLEEFANRLFPGECKFIEAYCVRFQQWSDGFFKKEMTDAVQV